MKLLLRTLLILNYPLLAISFLFWMSSGFAAVFVIDLTIENRTGRPLVVTPVGTARDGVRRRCPLHVMVWHFPPLRAGGFRLGAGESITLYYDRDDVVFSDLLVEDERGQLFQLAADPEQTQLQGIFVIDDVGMRTPAGPEVRQAAEKAPRMWIP